MTIADAGCRAERSAFAFITAQGPIEMEGTMVLQFFIVLVFAFALAVICRMLFPLRVSRLGFHWFFVLLLLAAWAGGGWMSPFGPTFRGVSWAPFVVAGLVAGILLILVLRPRAPMGRQETLQMLENVQREKELRTVEYISARLFLWLVRLVLIIAIFVRYVARH
jgi:hypothetical protein